MNYDGRIPPGGISTNTGTKLPEQPDDRKVKGKFKTASGGDRGVSVKEGKTHIPAATGNRPQERPLDDWEVKIQPNEQLFFKTVAELLTEDDSSAKQSHVRDELKTLHTCMADLLTEYNRRVSELAANDRIMARNLQQIKGPMIRVFQTVKDELVQLEKALAPNASKAAKREVKDVLPIAKSQIEQANKVLAEAKALLVESTLPPLPEIKVQPVPKPVSKEVEQEKTAQKKRVLFRKKTEPETKKPVDTIAPEQRLQNLRQRLQKAGPEHVPEILQHMVEALEKLGLQLEDHVRANPNDPSKEVKKRQFYKILESIRKASQIEVTPASVKNVRVEMRDQSWACLYCITQITGWEGKAPVKPAKTTVTTPPLQELKQATNAHLAASEIKFPALRKQVETLNAGTSTEAKSQALRDMDHYIYSQRERFNRLLPLLQAVATKCDFEKRKPPAESTHFYEAMGRLNKAMVPIRKRALSADYFLAIKEADAALAILDKFDQELPASLWHDLTETVAQPDHATPHFLNLMCRRILNEESGPLSERASLQKFTDICTYLEKVQSQKLDENTSAETIQAFRKVVGDGFSSPEKVKGLMAQARTLDEVRAVGFQLVNWTDMQHEYLEETCKKLDLVADDLELEGIQEGREELHRLTGFTAGTKAAAGEESAKRLALFEKEVKRAMGQIVKVRVEKASSGKNEKVCKKLEEELNGELGGVATIKLRPGKSQDEIFSNVDVKLSDDEQDIERMNATLSGKGKNAARLRELLLASDAKEVLVEDNQGYRWEPHPPEMIEKFANDFVKSFAKYERGVSLAREHERDINRVVAAREKADAGLKSVETAIPSVDKLKRKMRRRSKRRRQANNLGQLNTAIKGLKGKPLKRLTQEATPVRDLVVNMLRHKQLATDEAIELLGPLYQVQQAAMGTTPALKIRTQPLSPEKARRTEKLEVTLNELQKKYRWKNFWHRLTRKKRVEAVETAKSLVAICEACPHAPVANAQMLDKFVDELRKVERRHKDYQRLASSLSEYANHLQKNSTPVTYEQAAGAA